MLSTANITMQFGPKPLFENISVKFGEGNRYGLIGANGCGKSTFMKILGGDLEPSAGNVMLEPNVRLGKLRQDQFAYEDMRVLDVVMMGHTEMWAAMTERDAIYANPDATDDDYMRAAELEAKFAEYDGYTAEARAGELLLGIGIAIDASQRPDERRRAGLEAARAARAGAVLEPGRAAARRADQQPRHQLDSLARRRAEPVQLDDDHHLPRSPLPEPGLHAHGGHGLRHAEGLSGQLRRLHARVARRRGNAQQAAQRRRRRSASPICRTSCAASRRTSRRRARRRRARSRSRRSRSRKSSRRRAQNPFIRFERREEAVPLAVEVEGLTSKIRTTPTSSRT